MKSIKTAFCLSFVLIFIPVFAQSVPEKTFTMEELSKYDGQKGQPAYVAIDGIVYDMTEVGPWKGGVHKGYKAGQDITELIKKSPHGKNVVKNLKPVGKLKK